MNSANDAAPGEALTWLLHPDQMHSWADLAGQPAMPPPCSGVYGWYFDRLPAAVPVADCHKVGDWTLAYVGISPKAPPTNGKPPSKQHLRQRVRYHFRGNAEGSTLRLTLGTLLAADLGIQLRRVGSGKRMTFAAGEARLTAWLEVHARAVWVEHATPWTLEHTILKAVSLPLNLQDNWDHPFHPALSTIRKQAKAEASGLPTLPRDEWTTCD